MSRSILQPRVVYTSGGRASSRAAAHENENGAALVARSRPPFPFRKVTKYFHQPQWEVRFAAGGESGRLTQGQWLRYLGVTFWNAATRQRGPVWKTDAILRPPC